MLTEKKAIKRDETRPTKNKEVPVYNEESINLSTSASEAEERQRARIQAKKLREEKRKAMLKRTRKGQPVLHNQMKYILDKIQSV